MYVSVRVCTCLYVSVRVCTCLYVSVRVRAAYWPPRRRPHPGRGHHVGRPVPALHGRADRQVWLPGTRVRRAGRPVGPLPHRQDQQRPRHPPQRHPRLRHPQRLRAGQGWLMRIVVTSSNSSIDDDGDDDDDDDSWRP